MGPVSMEITSLGLKGHPLSLVHFSVHSYEETSSPLCPSQQRSRMRWLSCLDGVVSAGRAKVYLWRKVGPARRVTRL